LNKQYSKLLRRMKKNLKNQNQLLQHQLHLIWCPPYPNRVLVFFQRIKKSLIRKKLKMFNHPLAATLNLILKVWTRLKPS
jgi:hypothetical protein